MEVVNVLIKIKQKKIKVRYLQCMQKMY